MSLGFREFIMIGVPGGPFFLELFLRIKGVSIFYVFQHISQISEEKQ